MTRMARTYAVRRLVVVLALVVAAFAITLAVLPAQASEGGASAQTVTVTVQEDQSLWTIAREHSDGVPTDQVVKQIKALNGLDGSLVRPGQKLEVPSR